MLLDELLRLVPRETKDRVDNTRERANLIVRECLRNETGLRLKRPAIEAVVNVRVRLVGAQELVHILSGPYGIVPAAKQFVGNEVELAHFRV